MTISMKLEEFQMKVWVNAEGSGGWTSWDIPATDDWAEISKFTWAVSVYGSLRKAEAESWDCCLGSELIREVEINGKKVGYFHQIYRGPDDCICISDSMPDFDPWVEQS